MKMSDLEAPASEQLSLEVGYYKGLAPEVSCESWAVIHSGCFSFWLSACLSSLLNFCFPFLMIFFQLCSLSLYFCLIKWRAIKASCPREIMRNNGVAKLYLSREEKMWNHISGEFKKQCQYVMNLCKVLSWRQPLEVWLQHTAHSSHQRWIPRMDSSLGKIKGHGVFFILLYKPSVSSMKPVLSVFGGFFWSRFDIWSWRRNT